MGLMEMYRNQSIGARMSLICIMLFAMALASFYGFCIQDDAFISFRYAENWVAGNGLVFNPGEYVEGYTNLSWTVVIAAFNRLGFDSPTAALIMGYASIAFFILSTAYLAWVLKASPLVAAVLIAIDASVLLEGVQGLETVFFAGLCTLGVALLISESNKRKPYIGSTVVFAIAVLTRPEAPLVFGVAHLAALVWAGHRRWRPALFAGLSFACVLGAITLWRWGYYGDFIPNTARAKVGGIAIERGLQYLLFHALSHVVLWLGIAYAVSSLPMRFEIKITVACVLGYLFYVVVVGGDFKLTSRFILPVTGLFASLTALSLAHVYRRRKWVGYSVAILALLIYGWHYQRSFEWAKARRQNWKARRAAGLWIASHTPPDTVLAVRSVGVLPYYANRPTIDMWGLNDRTIANTPVADFGQGMAGHERENHEYVFALRLPDIYIPEDDVIELKPVIQPVEKGFPADFSQRYSTVNVQLGASWFNIWMRNDFLQDKMKPNP